MPVGWVPPAGWHPPVDWPPAPPGWQFWVPAATGPVFGSPYGAYAPRSKPGIDGFAITAFVSGLLGALFFTIGFGIAALRRIGRGERRGRAFVFAGWAASLVWIILAVAAFSFHVGRQPARADGGTVTARGQVSPAELQIGDCVDVPRDLTGPIRSLTVLPCAQPHNGQVFTILQADALTYPGSATLEQEGLADCKAAYPAFLGKADTLLHVVAFVPLERRWALGDRAEHCLLVDRQREITGDIRDDG